MRNSKVCLFASHSGLVNYAAVFSEEERCVTTNSGYAYRVCGKTMVCRFIAFSEDKFTSQHHGKMESFYKRLSRQSPPLGEVIKGDCVKIAIKARVYA